MKFNNPIPSPTLSIQYLEPSPDLLNLSVADVIDRLRVAAEKLPISHLIVGWQLPHKILEACRIESERLGWRFLRWEPLLTPVGGPINHASGQTVNLAGSHVPGYRGLPEFTFLCPNQPAVQETVSAHLNELIHQGIYQGVFLDRIRFPSPSHDLVNNLTCFCEHCRRKAAACGMDIDNLRQQIFHQTTSQSGWLSLFKTMLCYEINIDEPGRSRALCDFMDFRRRSVSDLLAQILPLLRGASLEVGLDCFSPSLTHMVGQDLTSLSTQVDWIKLMTYAHTLAPAGLPYELLGIIHNLVDHSRLGEAQALETVSQFTGLPLPSSCSSLEQEGVSSLALEKEVTRGIKASSAPILAGIELVDLPGVTCLNHDQIQADLSAIKYAGPAGLAISWDLWHIPPDRLDLVRRSYLS